MQDGRNAGWVPRAPVRGTQSFVDTMQAVWKRPRLTGQELLWRATVGLPAVALLVWQISRLWPVIPLDTPALEALTVFRPLEAFGILHTAWQTAAPFLLPVARWLLPLLLLVWTSAWAAGRGLVLKRMDRSLRLNFPALLGLRVLRTAGLLLTLGLWWLGSLWAASVAITGPGSRGHEPNLVIFCALVICGSLLLFVGWAAVNWVLDAAPLLAMSRNLGTFAAIGATLKLGPVRAKLVEINLVMDIIKICLIVLALVFSACPLPFEDIATTSFLIKWCLGVAVLFVVASDYFHVVRSAAYLALFGNAVGADARILDDALVARTDVAGLHNVKAG